MERTSSSQLHPHSFRGKPVGKTVFLRLQDLDGLSAKLTNSQRNYCNLSEDWLKVVQRILRLGLPSIQALETMKFPWLRYVLNGVRYLCFFSN